MPYTPGPFDSEHLYAQWGGKLPGGEGWSCGLRFAYTGVGVPGLPAGFLAGVKAAVQTYHTNIYSWTNANALLSFIKTNEIDVNGHYINQVTTGDVYADVPGGVAGVPSHPNQVALAVSLTTGYSRGLAHRGRFYSPLPNMPVAADGLIATAARDQVKTTATTLLTALNAVHADWKVAVFSRKSGAPTHRLVTGIAVGRAMDTQRRRRRKLTELW